MVEKQCNRCHHISEEWKCPKCGNVEFTIRGVGAETGKKFDGGVNEKWHKKNWTARQRVLFP